MQVPYSTPITDDSFDRRSILRLLILPLSAQNEDVGHILTQLGRQNAKNNRTCIESNKKRTKEIILHNMLKSTLQY